MHYINYVRYMRIETKFYMKQLKFNEKAFLMNVGLFSYLLNKPLNYKTKRENLVIYLF